MSAVVNIFSLIAENWNSDNIALIDDASGNQISYKDFANLVDNLSSQLTDCGVRENEAVVLLLEKSIFSVAVMVACLRLGACYIPLDLNSPQARLDYIIELANPRLILSEGENFEFLNYEKVTTPSVFVAASVFVTESSLTMSTPVIALRANDARKYPEGCTYVIFTSGSTGKPKGVQIGQGAVVAFLNAVSKEVSYDESTVFLNTSPLFFDASVLDIYMTLSKGGTLVLFTPPPFPSVLPKVISKYGVTDTLMVSTLLKLFASQYSGFEQADLSSLKSIWYGAEPCPTGVLHKIQQKLPEIVFIHGYGPTEVTHTSLFYVTKNVPSDNSYLPIGHPLDGLDARLDSSGYDSPYIGELLLAGDQVMLGYLGDLDGLNFIKIDEKIFYKTNDVVRIDVEGNYHFLCRNDDAVKVSGHFIHTTEIESAVNSLPGILSSTVIVSTKSDAGIAQNILILFYEGDRTPEAVTNELAGRLPNYMVPEVIRQLEANSPAILPSGKLDKGKLKELFHEF
ncbi:AMP-binding protein [Spartinivicinus poritis]|uniref:AMP-binding protein n=1 Tax=Spartinivicinus poritis TaxID=2994640 RepID=A0ABT5U809_9GAMM|nr:AMP-binding protein [Spartinivicinus sp. A2-2]MDE1462517.1 AMP-binding protein [Spartinivicinus sp. A2-2]